MRVRRVRAYFGDLACHSRTSRCNTTKDAHNRFQAAALEAIDRQRVDVAR
jgi:hypothetical protein